MFIEKEFKLHLHSMYSYDSIPRMTILSDVCSDARSIFLNFLLSLTCLALIRVFLFPRQLCRAVAMASLAVTKETGSQQTLVIQEKTNQCSPHW